METYSSEKLVNILTIVYYSVLIQHDLIGHSSNEKVDGITLSGSVIVTSAISRIFVPYFFRKFS